MFIHLCVHARMCGCVYSKGIKEVYGCLSSTGETSMLHKYQKYQKYQRKRRRREEEATVRKLQTISLQPQICVSTYTLLQSLTFLNNKSYEKTKTSNQHAPSCCFTCTILHCIQIKEENKVFLYLLNTRVLAFFKDETMYW